MGLFSKVTKVLKAASTGDPISSAFNTLDALGSFGSSSSGSRAPSIEKQVDDQAKLISGRMTATMNTARENGVHPLVALGMSPANGAVYSIGGDDGSTSAANDAYDLGQNIASAAARSQSPAERSLQAIISKQAVERGDLENELLKSQIAQIRSSINPATAVSNAGEMIAGQADSGADYINNQLVKHENSQGKESGSPSSWTSVKTKSGSDIMLPSKDFQDRAEDIPLIGWEWLFKNRAPALFNLLKEMKFGRDIKPYTKGGK